MTTATPIATLNEVYNKALRTLRAQGMLDGTTLAGGVEDKILQGKELTTVEAEIVYYGITNRMLRFIAAENTSRYSTGSPGRENALAVAEPPTKPISPGSVAAAAALTASRRNHLPRNLSMNFITATNPPFIKCHKKQLPSLSVRNETRLDGVIVGSTQCGDVAVG